MCCPWTPIPCRCSFSLSSQLRQFLPVLIIYFRLRFSLANPHLITPPLSLHSHSIAGPGPLRDLVQYDQRLTEPPSPGALRKFGKLLCMSDLGSPVIGLIADAKRKKRRKNRLSAGAGNRLNQARFLSALTAACGSGMTG